MGFVLRNVTVDFQDLSGIELRGEGRGEGDSWCKRSPGDLVDNPRAGETFLFLGRPWAFWELMRASRKNKSRIQPEPDKAVDKAGSRKHKELA